MNVKAFLQIAVSAVLFAIAILVFTYSAYLAGSVATGGPRLLLFAGAIVASALLVAYSYLNPGYRVAGCSETRIQASLGCLTSTQFERTEVTPSSIVQHYKRTYSLNAPTVFPRPNVGSAVESRTCHRCGREVVLQINSAKLARRDALKLAASVGVLLFGGWAIYLSLYFSAAPGYEREGLILPAFVGILVSLAGSGSYLSFWATSMFDRAAAWTTGDHRWFDADGKTVASPSE